MQTISLGQVLESLGIEATAPAICRCGRHVNSIEERIHFQETGECFVCDHVRGEVLDMEILESREE